MPAEEVPRALDVFNGGNAMVVVSVPLGSYLGAIIGWREAFMCLVPVAVIILVWQWISLPAMKIESRKKGTSNVLSYFESATVTAQAA